MSSHCRVEMATHKTVWLCNNFAAQIWWLDNDLDKNVNFDQKKIGMKKLATHCVMFAADFEDQN